ncbi:MAG: farnesyl diphosphate synthase [Bacillota bacterium]|nr:farnesyl diphosphate synthase [Bacillota bacterium]
MTFNQACFLQELNVRKKRIEEELKQKMLLENMFPPLIHKSMRYAVFNGGKRLRPILCMEGAMIAGGDWREVIPAACALEMIHSYSLVHDDLPAMDDDDFRRGKPTCHRVFGEANAILTGDALLTEAFGLIASGKGGVDPQRILRVIQEISSAAGSQGMVGGQVLDLDSDHKMETLEQLKTLHLLKTGALFKVALRSGAIMAGMNEEGLDALTEFAVNFGLAFQITDDILDVDGDQQTLGKPIGSDEKNGKITFVSLFGLEQAKIMAQQSVEQCLKSIQIFDAEADFLRDLAQFTLNRKS